MRLNGKNITIGLSFLIMVLCIVLSAVNYNTLYQGYLYQSKAASPRLIINAKDLKKELPDKPNITITNFNFGKVFFYEESYYKNKDYDYIIVPIIALDASSDQHFHALFFSKKINNDKELDVVLNQSEISGIVATFDPDISSEYKSILGESYPPELVNSAYFVHHDAHPKTAGYAILSFAGFIALGLLFLAALLTCGLTIYFTQRKQNKQR